MAPIGLAQRKKIELRQKLASLQSEFESWRDNSKAFAPLEKHQSQIHRVTLQLEGLQDQIRLALNKLPDVGPEVLTQARDLELTMLESHRAWEFFRSKLSLRSINWFNEYLIAADELAWECYSAAQAKLDPAYLPKEAVKEPPLVFFNGGSSPFTLPRDFAFQAEAVPGELVKSEQVFEVLRALPIPVIGVPWFQIQHLPEMLVVAHEVGHDVASDFKLKKDMKAALDQAMQAAGTDETQRLAWRAWLGETFADIYAVLCCGPAFVQSLIDFLATDPDKTAQAARTPGKWGLYPTDYLRVLLNIEALDAQDFATQRTELHSQWTDVYKTHAMTDYEKDIKVIVKAIIDGPYTAFGGLSLKDVILFSPTDQYNAGTDANSLLGGAGPQASNVRTLFAAARIAFSRDPQQYETLKIHKSILARVKVIRKAGVRGNLAAFVGPLGTLDDQDTAAGEMLFRTLAKRTPVNSETNPQDVPT